MSFLAGPSLPIPPAGRRREPGRNTANLFAKDPRGDALGRCWRVTAEIPGTLSLPAVGTQGHGWGWHPQPTVFASRSPHSPAQPLRAASPQIQIQRDFPYPAEGLFQTDASQGRVPVLSPPARGAGAPALPWACAVAVMSCALCSSRFLVYLLY